MSPEVARALTQADPAALGTRVRAARVALGLTQPELGADDASATYVSRIESGRRRPGPDLLAAFALRLRVTVEFLVLGEEWEVARRLELDLDHAELTLAGGESDNALRRVREVLGDAALDAVPQGRVRAAYVEAAALDALGDDGAVDAFERLLAATPDSTVAAKAATALSRILRERGELARAITAARTALEGLGEGLLGSEEGVRLSVTLAAALFEDGHLAEAATICDTAVREADRLASPMARASAYWNASIVRAETGDLGGATSLARRALHLLETTERTRDLGLLRTQLGDLMLRNDPPRVDEARQQLSLAGTELEWSAASPADLARHRITTARVLMMDGETALSREQALLAVEGASTGLPLVEVAAMTLLGQIDWAADARDDARGWYRRAITVLTGVGSDREAGQLWFELGILADEADLVDEARDAYRRAAAASGLTSRLPVAPRRTARV